MEGPEDHLPEGELILPQNILKERVPVQGEDGRLDGVLILPPPEGGVGQHHAEGQLLPIRQVILLLPLSLPGAGLQASWVPPGEVSPVLAQGHSKKHQAQEEDAAVHSGTVFTALQSWHTAIEHQREGPERHRLKEASGGKLRSRRRESEATRRAPAAAPPPGVAWCTSGLGAGPNSPRTRALPPLTPTSHR